MTQREAFEAWARQFHNIIAFDVRPDGLYRNVTLQREWAAWQASAAHAERCPQWWACCQCGNCGDAFDTVEHTIPMEPSDFDVKCLKCGSFNTAEIAEAVNALVRERDTLLERAEEKYWEVVEAARRHMEYIDDSERLQALEDALAALDGEVDHG